MPSLTELLAQRAALEAQIHEMSTKQRTEAIAQVRAIMGEFGLSPQDILGARTARFPTQQRRTGSVAAKFRNPATGDTWSGRGLKPKWLTAALATGKTLDYFRVGGEPAPAPVTATPESLLAEAVAAEKKPTDKKPAAEKTDKKAA